MVILLHEIVLPGLASVLRSLHGPRELLTIQPGGRKNEGRRKLN